MTGNYLEGLLPPPQTPTDTEYGDLPMLLLFAASAEMSGMKAEMRLTFTIDTFKLTSSEMGDIYGTDALSPAPLSRGTLLSTLLPIGCSADFIVIVIIIIIIGTRGTREASILRAVLRCILHGTGQPTKRVNVTFTSSAFTNGKQHPSRRPLVRSSFVWTNSGL